MALGLRQKDIETADQYLSGKTMEDIADIQDINKSTVSRRLTRPEVRKYIERIQEQFLTDNAEIAASNIKTVIANYQTSKDIQDKEHGFKASIRVLESVGILPAPTQSIVYNQINQSTNIISPAISFLLNKHNSDLKFLLEGQIIKEDEHNVSQEPHEEGEEIS